MNYFKRKVICPFQFAILLLCSSNILSQEKSEDHIERGSASTNLTYYFDSEGKITGILIFRDAKPIVDRLDEFKEWAKKNRSDGFYSIFNFNDVAGRVNIKIGGFYFITYW